MSRGLTKDGIKALDSALARHVERGDLPGLVALAARGDDVHVAAIGHKAFDDADPIGRDAIFRIASITKPIAGVAAMQLIEDEAMALDDPVQRWLPELAAPRVLRSLESPLDNTVPAGRPITVEGWEGGSGTTWRTDTAAGLTGILLTQRMMTSPEPTELVTDFWAAAYAAVDT